MGRRLIAGSATIARSWMKSGEMPDRRLRLRATSRRPIVRYSRELNAPRWSILATHGARTLRTKRGSVPGAAPALRLRQNAVLSYAELQRRTNQTPTTYWRASARPVNASLSASERSPELVIAPAGDPQSRLQLRPARPGPPRLAVEANRRGCRRHRSPVRRFHRSGQASGRRDAYRYPGALGGGRLARRCSSRYTKCERHGLRDLHVGLDGGSEGRSRLSSQRRQSSDVVCAGAARRATATNSWP